MASDASLHDIDESLRHHAATLAKYRDQGDQSFADIARRKIDERLDERLEVTGHHHVPLPGGTVPRGCPSNRTGHACAKDLCGHCQTCGDYLDNHANLSVDGPVRNSPICPSR